MTNNKTKQLTLIGLFAALVFVASFLSIPIATPLGNTRIHFGNIFCLLSGFILGGLNGGLAAGIGSMFFDLVNPLYIASAPFTLVFKFAMAFFAGKISHIGGASSRNIKLNIIGGIVGAVSYVILYLSKGALEDLFFLKAEIETVIIDITSKGIVSLANAVIAVVVAIILTPIILKAVKLPSNEG